MVNVQIKNQNKGGIEAIISVFYFALLVFIQITIVMCYLTI